MELPPIPQIGDEEWNLPHCRMESPYARDGVTLGPDLNRNAADLAGSLDHLVGHHDWRAESR